MSACMSMLLSRKIVELEKIQQLQVALLTFFDMKQTAVNALGFRTVIQTIINSEFLWLIKVKIYFYIIYNMSLEGMQIQRGMIKQCLH